MAQPTTLTHSQVEVLRWIKGGCASGIYEDYSHRITAGALRRRGLAETSGKGPTWKATITKAGRDYLKWVDGPNPPQLRGEPERPQLSKLQGLVFAIQIAGGALRVPSVGYASGNRVDWDARARTAEQHGLMPTGTWLVALHHPGEIELRIEPVPPGLMVDGKPTPVVVPDEVKRYHPAARSFRDTRARHEVSEAQLKRALRIVHAIATDAERRGWEVLPSTESEDKYGRSWSAARDGHFRIKTPLHEFMIRLSEGGVRTRGAWDDELERHRRWRYSGWTPREGEAVPTGRYDADGTGLFKLELMAEHRWDFGGRRRRWNDTDSRRIEDMLGSVLWEVEARLLLLTREAEVARKQAAVAAERARVASKLRENAWVCHVRAAQAAWLEDQRQEQFRELAARQHDIAVMRELCEALRARHDDNQTTEYLAWAERYVAANDPLTEPPVLLSEPTTLVDELEPFMPEGWTAAGADKQPRRRSAYEPEPTSSSELHGLIQASNRHPWRSHWASRR